MQDEILKFHDALSVQIALMRTQRGIGNQEILRPEPRKSKCCQPDGWTPETEPLADGFGCVTPTRECGPTGAQAQQGD
jgi:hypothetical protein